MVKGSSDIFMKDADPQQRNELLGELKNVFVNATEGTCGFHIVNMGWKNTCQRWVSMLVICRSGQLLLGKFRNGFTVG